MLRRALLATAPKTGWTLEFDLPAGVTMGGFHHGTATQNGSHVTVVNAHYNGTVAAGASTEPYSPWFIAYGSGAAPLNCRVNGNKCDGSADRPPNAPNGLSVTGRTTRTVTLSWNAGTATDFPIIGYDILVAGVVKASATGTTATVNALSPNTTYAFTLRAGDSRGNLSALSAPVNGTTLNPADDTTPPTTPGNLRSKGRTATTVGLARKASTDASGIAGYDIADYARPMSAAQSVDGVADTGWEPLRGNFDQLRKLKSRYPRLKVLISIGNLPSYNGAGGPGSAAGIFDSIDLDWEWPGAEGHPGNIVRAQDKANNTLLMAEFRRQLDALTATTGKRYLLTAFTPADPAKTAAGWEMDVFRYMDFANVQGYDFHGAGSDNSWEPNRTGHQANLLRDAQDPYPFDFSVDRAIQSYLDGGVNPRQLTVGFPFYGRGWQGVVAGGSAGEWQSATGATPGQFQEEAGTRGYANLLATVPNCTVFHDTQSGSTYCFTGNGGQWWSYDDPWSIQQKTSWLRSKGLLGAMVWEMSGDTATGTLMTTLHNGLSS
ncbi:MAG TPA: glycosyl hydrolase family 18 protein [Candidatus Limnocylindrales bacterium]